MGHKKEPIRFGDLDLIFKVAAVERLKTHGWVGNLFSLKILLLVSFSFFFFFFFAFLFFKKRDEYSILIIPSTFEIG